MAISLSALGDRAPVIVSYARTAFGKLNGSLKSLSAPQIGAVAMQGALSRAQNIDKENIGEVFFGNVLSGGLGQAPATQAVIFAGFGENIPSTTINKVCSSGMKSLAFGATSIALGLRDCVLCGGMESMTRAPHMLQHARTSGLRLGDTKLVDSLIHDGLWDPYENVHMGICAELIANEMGFSRSDQDMYAAESYSRAHKSRAYAARDIVTVDLPPERRKQVAPLVEDEECKHSSTFEELATLKPAFKPKDGTVTAGNASSINDGAAALILTSRKFAREHNITPLCDIVAIADAQTEPKRFTIAPALAIPLALEAAGSLDLRHIDRFEINEAFAVAAMANAKLLNIPYEILNVHGGAVAIGHPIGASGARLVGSLAADIAGGDIQTAVAAICNGGGGASAMVLQKAAPLS